MVDKAHEIASGSAGAHGAVKAAGGGRSTRRKRQIRELLTAQYGGGPVLLDELRWAAFSAGAGPASAGVGRSWLNSFARTIREQFPDYRIDKISLADNTPVGIVARSAVYRLKDPQRLRDFLNGSQPCILCRYTTNMEFEEPRYRSRYVTPFRYAATFRFFSSLPTDEISYSTLVQKPGTLIPGTHKLSILVHRHATVDLHSFATVPWKLFGYNDLNDWHEVDAAAGLSAIHRNREF